jgi:hypothetical protein
VAASPINANEFDLETRSTKWLYSRCVIAEIIAAQEHSVLLHTSEKETLMLELTIPLKEVASRPPFARHSTDHIPPE